MDFSIPVYMPEKLIKVCEEITLERQEKEAYETSDFGNLKKKVADVSDSMKKAVAMSIPQKEIDSVISNISKLSSDEEQAELLDALSLISSHDIGRKIYRQWQNDYKNPSLIGYIKKLTETDSNFQSVLKDYNISKDQFIKILESESIPLSFDSGMINAKITDLIGFDDNLRHLGIDEKSTLGLDCKRALLIICSREEYLSCSDKNIIEIITGFDEILFRKFLFNFLNKLSIKDLEKFSKLALYINEIIGKSGSEKFVETFKECDEKLIRKYMNFVNISKMNIYFNGDERFIFWKQYRATNVKYHEISQTVIIGFNRHVVIELMGESRGTTYICDNNVFKDIIRRTLDTMVSADIAEFFAVNRKMFIDRKTHYIRWQNHVKGILRKKNIAKLI